MEALNWQKFGNYKKPFIFKIKDILDFGITGFKPKIQETVKPIKLTKEKLKELEKPVILIEEKSYKEAKSIEHYVMEYVDIPVSIPVPKFSMKRKEIALPNLKFKKNKRQIVIPVPNIKIDIKFLKKFALLIFIMALPISLIFIGFTAWRLVDFTNADFMNETMKYKMEKYVDEKLDPYMNKVDMLQDRVSTVEANKSTVNVYQVKKKIKSIRVVNGKVVEVKEWDQ